ncbi:MAG: SAM-dependent chlorinase/fluorinase [Chloroflexota bacterium]|nr:SAM-dependent chlorinase/fluorinase [Chloroflexota bacterium]
MQLPSSSSKQRPVITFLTDFGTSESYVGVMKGVALNICADAQLVDVTHDIAPQQVAVAAWQLSTSYRYFPAGTIHVCVVDPGVGSARQPIALHAGDWFFVGPDNGLFSYVLAQQPVHEAIVLTNPAYHLPQVSTTFHGRDIFSPAAAHIASGVSLEALGTRVDPSTLQRIDAGPPERQGSQISAHIIHADHFGNLISTIPFSLVPDLFSSASVRLDFPAQGVSVSERRRFFSAATDKGEPFIYVGSSGYVAVAIQNGNAAKTLGVTDGAAIKLVVVGE